MTQRDRIVVAVVGVMLVLGGYWLGALKPKREELKKVDAQVTQQRERLDSALAKIRAGEAARSRFAEDYATVARLGKAVPVDDQLPSLVYQLEAASDRARVDFRSLSLRAEGAAATAPQAAPPAGEKVPATQAAAAVAPPGSTVGAAGFPTMPFTFNFEGDFFRMERLLSTIERFTGTISAGGDVRVAGRLLTVDGFGIKKSSLRPWPSIETSVLATAYLLPPEEGAFGDAGPDGPADEPSTQNAGAPAKSSPTPTASAGGIVP